MHVRNGKVVVYSRRHDWTETFGSIARAAASRKARHAVLDGEAIVQDARGVSDYHALRSELARKRGGNLTYYAFDLLYLDGEDLRPLPLHEHKARLKALLTGAPAGFLYADYLEAEPSDIFAQACKMGLECIVSKRRDAPYRSSRQESWVKAKCSKSGSFPIIAFVEKLGAKPRRMASFYIGLGRRAASLRRKGAERL